MPNLQQKKITLDVPIWVEEVETPEQSYFDFLVSLAFSKMQDYKVRQQVYLHKYQQEFPKFEEAIKLADSEDMEKWDDYIVWKALYDSYKKWESRYHQLVR